ncbi:MAG: hypothetical protein L3J52_05205, partial [Proteobacteria bacterium]|nr:hypothetical protein [Pseudomonadota bacterium]
SSIFYHYKGLKVQGGGRGSLGFSEMSTVDVQNKVSTQSLYKQDFPFTGSPSATLKSHHSSINNIASNGYSCAIGVADCPYNECSGASCSDPIINGTIYDPLSDAVNEYEAVSPASNAGTHFVFLKKTIEDFYELGSNTAFKTLLTEMDYENKAIPQNFYGNVSNTSSKICSNYTNGVCSVVSSSSVSNTYNNSTTNINNWILARLSSSTSTQSRRNETSSGPAFFTVNNNSSFTYNPTTGQLETETSGTGSDQYIKTIRIHDSYGNETNTLMCSQSVVNANNCTTSYLPPAKAANQLDIFRHSQNIYDSDWRLFVDESKTLFGTQGTTASMRSTSQVISRDVFGNIIEATDLINNITTESVYGLFGEPQASKTNAGTYTQTLNSWCTASTCPGTGAVVSTTTIAGAPTSREYRDAQGRTIRAQSQSMGSISNPGTWSTVDSWYDESGRAQYTTVPYFASASPIIYLSSNTYDDLGRVTQTRTPNHVGTDAITSTFYNGLAMTFTNANNQKKVTLSDETGKVIKIDQYLDNPNTVYSTIEYYYGANDKLIQMDSNGASTTMSYDNLGRKTSMNDPDKGNWTYTHTPTGDMLEQTDALGQVISFSYDVQGRQVSQTGSFLVGDQQINNQWYFGENGDIGKLTRETSTSATDEKVDKDYTYDNFGRPKSITTRIYDGDNGNNYSEYTQSSTYDQYSRAFQNIDATGYGTMYLYDSYGYQHQTLEAVQCLGNLASCEIYKGYKYRLYYQAINMDPFGNITKDQFHKGALTTLRNYNAKDGIMENTCLDTTPDSNCTGTPQDKIVLSFDKLGNLINKTSSSGTETFTYDELNRLKTENRNLNGNNKFLTYTYTANGNLTNKDNSTLSYNGTKPHAVSSFKGTTFNYDANGNMITSTSGDFRRTIAYSGLSKAYQLKNDNSNKSNYFIYDANHSRAVRKDSDATMRTKTTHYIGNVEIIKSASNGYIETYKRYIGGLIIDLPTKAASQNIWKYNYQFKDHLGSSHNIITLNVAGIQTESQDMSFDAWGQRRWSNNLNISDINLGDIQFEGLIAKTTRGYTGHEHLDETGIIHMNGRIYAPHLGRFLQADPIIQAPFSTQSLNRYTYVQNNPLSANDPTGYWSVDAFMQNIGNSSLYSIIGGMFGTDAVFALDYFMVKSATGSKKKALISAYITSVQIGAFQAIGAYYGGLGGLTIRQFAAKIALHGLVGGAAQFIKGGNFGNGFISAGVTQSLSRVIGRFGRRDGGISPTRVFISAVVGGTASRLSGGKFANGAVTGAFSRLFNDEKHDSLFTKVSEKLSAMSAVSENVTVKGGSKEQRAQVYSLLVDIAGTEKGQEMFDSFGVNQGVIIKIIHRGQSIVFSEDGLIHFNFNNGFIEGIDGSQITFDPIRVLAHELGHIANPPLGEVVRGSGYESFYENRIIKKYENPIVNELYPDWILRGKWEE